MVDMPEGIGYGEMYEEPGEPFTGLEPFFDRQRRRGRRRPNAYGDLTKSQEYRDASPELQARMDALQDLVEESGNPQVGPRADLQEELMKAQMGRAREQEEDRREEQQRYRDDPEFAKSQSKRLSDIGDKYAQLSPSYIEALGGAIGGAAGDAAGPMQAQARAMEGGVMRQEDEARMRQLQAQQAQQMQQMQPPPGFGGDFIGGEPSVGLVVGGGGGAAGPIGQMQREMPQGFIAGEPVVGGGGGGLTGQMQPMPQSPSQGGPTGQIQELRGQETLGRHVPDMRAMMEEAQRQRMQQLQQQGGPSEQQMQQMQQVQPYSPQDPDIRALGVDPNKRRGLQRQAPIIGNEPVMGY